MGLALKRRIGKSAKDKLERELERSREEHEISEEAKRLIREIDVEVKKLADIFRLVLKYKIVFRGRGLEFYGLRQYEEGDDTSLIDWKSTLRANIGKITKLYIKVFEEERDLDVMVMLDASPTMLFGTGKRLKSEYATLIAGAITYAALQNGDNAGIIMFSDRINRFVPPLNETSQHYRILSTMLDRRNWRGKKDLASALDFAVKLLRRETMLFIISDFIGVHGKWEDKLRLASSKFEGVLGIMVRDRRDIELPKGTGYYRLKDPLTGRVMEVNLDKYAEKYKKEALRQMRMVEEYFQRAGVGLIKYVTDEPFVKPIIHWLDIWAAGRGI